MAGQGNLKKILGGSGSGVPVNGFVDMYETDNVVTKGDTVYFKTGYVDTAVANYPDASKRKWQRIPFSSTVSIPTWGTTYPQVFGSDMQYRFGRYIVAYRDLTTSNFLRIASTSDINVSPSNYSDDIGSGSVGAQACMVWNASESKLRVYCMNANKVYETTNGTSYTTNTLTGLTTSQYIIDVILVGSTYVALVNDGIYTSTNGIAWTLRQSWSISPVGALYYGKLATDGTKVYAAYQGLNIYYTSTNLTLWTTVNTPSGYTSTGFIGYSNAKWQATFRSADGNNYSAIGNDGSAWSMSQSSIGPITEVKWHSLLEQYVGGITSVLSKNGLDWISLATTSNGMPNGISRWVINGSTTYGLGSYGSVTYGIYSDTLPEVVGLPYSLTTITLNANRYLRVK